MYQLINKINKYNFLFESINKQKNRFTFSGKFRFLFFFKYHSQKMFLVNLQIYVHKWQQVFGKLGNTVNSSLEQKPFLLLILCENKRNYSRSSNNPNKKNCGLIGESQKKNFGLSLSFQFKQFSVWIACVRNSCSGAVVILVHLVQVIGFSKQYDQDLKLGKCFYCLLPVGNKEISFALNGSSNKFY